MQIPFTPHAFDLDAYAACAWFIGQPPTAIEWHALPSAARDRLIALYWRGLLRFDGQPPQTWNLTDFGADFCKAMRHALRQPPSTCIACGGPYCEATGHVFTWRARLCGPCARHFVGWLKPNLNRRWGKANFYEHAATSIREGVTPPTDGRRR